MTTNFRLLAMAAVAMLAMNSCVKEENLNNGDKKGTPVEFEMGVNSVSRTSTPDDGYATTFVEGDEVGIFVYEGETPVVINAPYKLAAGGKWEAQGKIITAEEGKTYNYYAYYPYNAEVTEATSVSLTVASDQTTGYTGSDALMAKSENVDAGTTTVPLQYSHAFALVQVSLEGNLAASNATVTLQNVYPTAALDLKAGTVGTAAGTMGTVAMKACTTNGEAAPFNYRAIVPAQTITANTGILTTFSNGKNYKFTYSVDVPYESGKLRQFDVTLGGATGNTIEIGQGTILDWTDGSDVEGGTGGVEEIVPTYINPIGSTLADVTGAPSFEEDTWFGLKRNAEEPGDISYSIETDETTTWGKAAKFSYTSTWDAEANKGEGKAVNNSWYLATLGYYHCSADAPINGGIYKVTLKVKGGKTTAGSTSKLVFTCRNADNSSSFGAATNQNFLATTVSVTPDAANTWQEYTFYINFDKKSTAVGTVPTTDIEEGKPNYAKRWIDSSASDYSKFDLRIYTNDAATATVTSNTATIYISDLVMEPYVAE